jgi:hypothetical protein
MSYPLPEGWTKPRFNFGDTVIINWLPKKEPRTIIGLLYYPASGEWHYSTQHIRHLTNDELSAVEVEVACDPA